jgi:hypothetical protein
MSYGDVLAITTTLIDRDPTTGLSTLISQSEVRLKVTTMTTLTTLTVPP